MIKFGTGGWRAVIGDDFTKANIQLLAQGLVNKMKSEGVTEQGIVMGYDRRFLSKEAMQWAVGEGIITGKYQETQLDPQGEASRAECATIMMRFMERYGG